MVSVWVSIGSITGGGALVFFASNWESFIDVGPMKWAAVISALGAAVMAVGALALTFELSTRRSVMRETLAATQLSDEIRASGLTALLPKRDDAHRQFQNRVENARNVDLLFISASTWMTTNRDGLRHMLKHGGRVRLLIPDPDDVELLTQLLTRFDYDGIDELRTDVRHTHDLARSLSQQFPEMVRKNGFDLRIRRRGSDVTSGFAIRRLTVVPTYSLYKVDHFGVLRVHEIRKPAAETHPVLVFSERGDLDSFAMADFEYLWGSSSKIEPPDAGKTR